MTFETSVWIQFCPVVDRDVDLLRNMILCNNISNVLPPNEMVSFIIFFTWYCLGFKKILLCCFSEFVKKYFIIYMCIGLSFKHKWNLRGCLIVHFNQYWCICCYYLYLTYKHVWRRLEFLVFNVIPCCNVTFAFKTFIKYV